jgi:hypothetical protein
VIMVVPTRPQHQDYGLNQDTTGAGAGAGDATLLLGLDGLAVTG